MPILVALALKSREEEAYQLASHLGSDAEESRRLIAFGSKVLNLETTDNGAIALLSAKA